MVMLFWSSVFLVIYAYAGYPLLLRILVLFMSKEVHSQDNYCPSVTLIIAVHNEETRIEKKIQNTVDLDYPKEKLEVIFTSDASTDETDSRIIKFQPEGIQLVRSPGRRGKEYAQKIAIEQAKGEILVFSDVATMLEMDGIRKIVSNFADATIGCVSSEDKFIDQQGQVSGEGAYVRYEMWLRSLESRVNSVVGLSGSFFAARKAVCSNWPTDIPSDFNTLLNSIRAGYRGISDPRSIGIYTNIKEETREFERKVRTITRGISALMANRKLLNPVRYGLFSWQLISHKLLRWLVPGLLTITFAVNIGLAATRSLYRLLLIPHSLFYLLGFVGPSLTEKKILVRLPYYFIQVNRAIAVAWFKYLKGERFVTWTPSNR